MASYNKSIIAQSLKTLTKDPLSAYTWSEIATVTNVSPLTLNCNGVTIGSGFIYTTPFAEKFETEIYKHKHTYRDWNNGEGANDGNNSFDTSEELNKVEVWRGLKVGDSVLVVRTNKSQKYIVLCRVNKLDDRG